MKCLINDQTNNPILMFVNKYSAMEFSQDKL